MELPEVAFDGKTQEEILASEEALRAAFEQEVLDLGSRAVQNGLSSEDAAWVLQNAAKTIRSFN